MPENTPILLIIHRRTESLAAQIDILRRIRPRLLYVFADGPVDEADREACREARSVLEGIDWDCSVHRRMLDRNLGCGRGPAEAVTWFFEHEAQGIVLEDDLLPHSDFFRFMAEMLERYRDDERVMDICGTNRLGSWQRARHSYVFSQWGSSSGWGSWRRAWRHFDFGIEAWDLPETRRVVRDIFRGPWKQSYMRRILDMTRRGGEAVTWWDYQWGLAKNLNSGLSVVPATSLVRNVGCDGRSTHDRLAAHRPDAPAGQLGIFFPLRHPKHIHPDGDFDEALLGRAISARNYASSLVPHHIKLRLKGLLG